MRLAVPEHDPRQLWNLSQTTIHAAVPAGLRVTKATEALFLIFRKVQVISERCFFLLGPEQSKFSSQQKGCRLGFPGYGMSALQQ